ncbi:MAG: phospholipase D-like domain-containing protein, partial [Candidatus Omnitrophota bacterium]
SVKVVMYIIELPQSMNKDKVQQLVDELVQAKERGVDVEVILDKNVDFVNMRDKSEWQEKVRSIRAYKQFKKAGIKVYYDHLSTYTHAKTLVIDKKIVILGSTNWTQNSLERSIETDVRIESEQLAESILSYFKSIDIDKDSDPLIDVSENSLILPSQFLQDPRFAPAMMKKHDERVFDTYLFLLNAYKGAPITLFYDSLAKHLNIEVMGTTAYRRQIIKVLKKLESKYKLITFTPRYAKEASIILLSYDDPRNSYIAPDNEFFELPEEYFTLAWHRRLSMRAKFCYLINSLNTRTSDILPFWSKSIKQITRECGGVSAHIIFKGMDELRRKRLLEVEYDDLTDKPYDKRSPKTYRMLPFFDFDLLVKEIDALEQKYGKATFDRARAYAKIVFEAYNPQVIEDIIIKEKEYGKTTLKKAFNIVAQKNTDNPKKTYGYVVGILENWGE